MIRGSLQRQVAIVTFVYNTIYSKTKTKPEKASLASASNQMCQKTPKCLNYKNVYRVILFLAALSCLKHRHPLRELHLLRRNGNGNDLSVTVADADSGVLDALLLSSGFSITVKLLEY
jgi:hypothetical protein